MNTANNVIEKVLISKGGIGSINISMADIFRPIFLSNGNNFILAHNHPSGQNFPSEEDIAFTKKVMDASRICGLNFLDHVIFTSVDYTSLKAEGLI